MVVISSSVHCTPSEKPGAATMALYELAIMKFSRADERVLTAVSTERSGIFAG
jgi:hypothetical protein